MARSFARGLRPLRPLVLLALLGGGLLPAGCGGSSADKGLEVARERGCTQCHSASGVAIHGPSWKGLAGSTVTFSDGSTTTADRDYLVESMKNPGARMVTGWEKVAKMPAVPLSTDEIDSLIAYIDSLK